MKNPKMETDTTTKDDAEVLRLCRAAIFHVLDAIASDPRKFWLMGYGTGSREKLLAAWCALTGTPEEEAKDCWLPDEEKYKAYCEEKEAEERRAFAEEFPFPEELYGQYEIKDGLVRILDALGGPDSLFRLGFTEMERRSLITCLSPLR